MVFTPLKLTWIQSGNAPAVASFHPPPAPHPAPERLLSISVPGRNPALFVLYADATPPLDASATFVPLKGALTIWVHVALTDAEFAESPP